ncbi:hypothetical protein GGI35DRAFT_198969 [Trichoderma velutinum]
MELAHHRELSESMYLGPPISLECTVLNPGYDAHAALHIRFGTVEALRTFLSILGPPVSKQVSLYTKFSTKDMGQLKPLASGSGQDRLPCSITIVSRSLIRGPITFGGIVESFYPQIGHGVASAMRLLSESGSRLSPFFSSDVMMELIPQSAMKAWLAHRLHSMSLYVPELSSICHKL